MASHHKGILNKSTRRFENSRLVHRGAGIERSPYGIFYFRRSALKPLDFGLHVLLPNRASGGIDQEQDGTDKGTARQHRLLHSGVDFHRCGHDDNGCLFENAREAARGGIHRAMGYWYCHLPYDEFCSHALHDPEAHIHHAKSDHQQTLHRQENRLILDNQFVNSLGMICNSGLHCSLWWR
jgi:hypothetical protein